MSSSKLRSKSSSAISISFTLANSSSSSSKSQSSKSSFFLTGTTFAGSFFFFSSTLLFFCLSFLVSVDLTDFFVNSAFLLTSFFVSLLTSLSAFLLTSFSAFLSTNSSVFLSTLSIFSIGFFLGLPLPLLTFGATNSSGFTTLRGLPLPLFLTSGSADFSSLFATCFLSVILFCDFFSTFSSKSPSEALATFLFDTFFSFIFSSIFLNFGLFFLKTFLTSAFSESTRIIRLFLLNWLHAFSNLSIHLSSCIFSFLKYLIYFSTLGTSLLAFVIFSFFVPEILSFFFVSFPIFGNAEDSNISL